MHDARRRDRDEDEARQVMGADEHRIDVQRQRQRQHGVHRAGRERHHDVAEFERHSRRKLVEYLDHHLMGRGNAPVQGFAAIGLVVSVTVRKGGLDALQDALGIEWPRYRIGCAERPGLHRPVVKGVGENKQPRHRAVALATQLVSNPLHAFGGTQIDIDHNAGNLVGRRVGEFRRRHRIDLADRLEDTFQIAALLVVVGGEQQAAFGRTGLN